MTARSAQHDTFTIERHYAAAPARVFRAFADQQAKSKWFGSPDPAAQKEDVTFDFREGGRETATTIAPDGTRYGFAATYTDIVPDERLVYTYEMSLNGARISVSVATVQIRSGAAGGTDFTITEQGVYLDGLDNSDQRRGGTELLMDALGKSLTDGRSPTAPTPPSQGEPPLVIIAGRGKIVPLACGQAGAVDSPRAPGESARPLF